MTDLDATARHTSAIPCPPATARVGWTLYRRGQVIGWVRRSEDAETGGRMPGTYWTIPRYGGAGDPAAYLSVRHAAQSPFLTEEV